MVDVPGPLDSFLRMAGISQEITPADVLPLLARNAFLYGHVGERRTEYLVLVDRYVRQARELRSLASGDGMIRVSGCGDVGPLIQVLGYKFENGCNSKDATLITADAERAFLTVNSRVSTHEARAISPGGSSVRVCLSRDPGTGFFPRE